MKSNTDRETALRKIVKELILKDIYKKLWPISHGHRSGALSRVKVPIADMIYCPTTDELFHHSRGAFYAHARLEPLDGDEMLFSTQRRQKPLPTKHVYPAVVTEIGGVYRLTGHDNTATTVWKEVTDSEELVCVD